ncbi:MAG: serine--tRNA ligase [Bacillota bacterium]|nr:serine--tRNA ligase [Bacillota bacterium]
MLDLRLIRANPERVKEGLAKKNAGIDIDEILALDGKRRSLIIEADKLKSERNSTSEQIAAHKKQQKDAEALILKMRDVSQRIKELDEQLGQIEKQIDDKMWLIPNLPHDTVPVGVDATYNVEIRRCGKPPEFDFEPKAHWDLGPALGVLDFERAGKVAGSRFVFLKGLGARLERALVNYMLDLHTTRRGYTELFPPFMANRAAMSGTGQLPKFEADMFRVAGTDYFLIPTAEVPLTNIHRDEVLDGAALPIYYTAYSACFRAEAGAAGKDTRGLIRNHQFNKVELVKFCLPETSYDELESLTSDAEDVLKGLGLAYRVVCLSSGDMSFSSAKTYDLEVWLPSYNGYKEISSCSNFEDFQARRANIRVRRAPGAKLEYAHTLNGSGLAIGRTFAAILENFQNADGTVTIPEVLRPYMDNAQRIAPA